MHAATLSPHGSIKTVSFYFFRKVCVMTRTITPFAGKIRITDLGPADRTNDLIMHTPWLVLLMLVKLTFSRYKKAISRSPPRDRPFQQFINKYV